MNEPGYSSYPAVMQLQPNPAGVPAGPMAYPPCCTASLTFMRNEDEAYWFRESIQEGKGKCVNGGQISDVPMSNDTVAWQYFSPGDVSSPMATATFRR